MENATKALTIAGGILISMMIIGALLLTYNGITNYQKTSNIDVSEAQVIEFNNQFITYNRDNVRGNDLYSLLNRAVDYNKRKTTVGTTDEAKNKLGFMPITIKMSFGDNVIVDNATNPFSADGKRRMILEKEYEVSDTSNDFEDAVLTKIRSIENKYGQDSATNLVTAYTKIFIDSSSNATKKQEAIQNFNVASKKITISNWNDIKEGTTIREDICTYYEYIQFKRAIFECTKAENDPATGRIVKMEFKFTGKIQ